MQSVVYVGSNPIDVYRNNDITILIGAMFTVVYRYFTKVANPVLTNKILLHQIKLRPFVPEPIAILYFR